MERRKTALAEICVRDGCDVVSKNSGGEIGFEQPLTSRSKNFNIKLREVIFGCCVTNTYDDDTMSPDVDINH